MGWRPEIEKFDQKRLQEVRQEVRDRK